MMRDHTNDHISAGYVTLTVAQIDELLNLPVPELRDALQRLMRRSRRSSDRAALKQIRRIEKATGLDLSSYKTHLSDSAIVQADDDDEV